MKIEIREERQKDYYETEHMVMRAFWNIHGPGCNEHLLVRILRNSKDYLPQFSRVAVCDGRIVGAIFFSKAKVVDGDKVTDVLTFGPLAIEPTMQNMGIGKKLMDETFKLAKDAGYPGIIILGEPKYYPKYGFIHCSKYNLVDADGNCWDAMLAYPLDEEKFDNISGVFYESPDFEKADDENALAEISKEFPPYEKIKLQDGFQLLYSGRIGKVDSIKDDIYMVKFWEMTIPAKLDSKLATGKEPRLGDVVIFEYERDGISTIYPKK